MTAARKALMKWVASIAFVAVVILLLLVVNDADIVIVLGLVLFFLAAPMLVLLTIEMGKTLREAPEAPRALRAVGLILSIPQALFGFVAVALGVAITLWTAYNLLVERQPQFTGGLIPSLGIGPALALAGYWWMRTAFTRKRGSGR